jgi:hypothetical protein
MSATLTAGLPPFGLFELDPSGMVLYSRPDSEGETGWIRPDVAGLNFYEEVAPFCNVEEFRRRVVQFTQGVSPADSFHFDCEYEGGTLTVRVLLARIRERLSNDRTKSVLIHIRRGA